LHELSSIANQMEQYKPTPDAWSATEITEHLAWAEQGGILMMWKATQAHQQGKDWEGENTNASLSIEELVGRTWHHEQGRPKEQAPASAIPRLGGPLNYWKTMLGLCQPLLNELTVSLRTIPESKLDSIIYPHVIMGPLTLVQRLEFLRFHLDHHREQVIRLKENITLNNH
jgi:hypothetical protein